MRRELFIDIIVGLLIILFVYTGVSKLIDSDEFGSRLRTIEMFRYTWQIVGIGIPLVELFVALLLMIPKWRRVGLCASFCLMVIFTGYVTIVLTIMKHPPCNCSGVIEKMNWRQHLMFNIIYTLIALIGMIMSGRRKQESVKANTSMI